MARRTLFTVIASLTVLTVAGVSLARPHDSGVAVRIADFAEEPAVTTTTVAPATTTSEVPASTTTTEVPIASTTSTTEAPAPSTTTTERPRPRPSTTTTEKPKPITTTTTEKPEKPKPQTTPALRLACKRLDDAHIACRWGDVPDGTTRIALMRSGGGGESKTVYMTTDPSARSAVDASVVAGETYVYRLAAGAEVKLAESDALKVPPTGEEVSTDRPAADPKTSVELACKQTGGLQVTCRWGAIPDGATKVALMRERPGTPSQPIFISDDLAKHEYVDAAVDNGGTYVYRLAAGNSNGITAGSAPIKMTIGGGDGQSEGVALSVVCGQTTVETRPAIVCEWSDPKVAVAAYRVFRRPTGESSYRQVGIVEVRRVVDKEVTSGAFQYLVQGLDNDGKVVALGDAAAKCCTPAVDGR